MTAGADVVSLKVWASNDAGGTVKEGMEAVYYM